MNNRKNFLAICFLLMLSVGISQSTYAQGTLAQQAYAIFQQNCLNCHGEHGAFTEEIIIEHTALIETGAVVPGNPIQSTLYTRLLEKDPAKRMPLGQPQLSGEAILTIGNWIQAGAPDWTATAAADGNPFITLTEMLNSIENHVSSLPPFDRTFARYFTTTHLYNAGETTEALHAYQRALSKLVNSLSWGREVIRPEPIDTAATIFYIDLRDYEWELGTNRWTLIETEYPYSIEFSGPTETTLRERLTGLRQALNCEVPFVQVDWFLATASLPPLYHDILGLPETDLELETRLEVNVVENIRNAAGRRVWRAGFNNSGVSNHNRVVERHTSRYGSYWKSYDFAGSVGTQNIFTHPLSFTHDGGEIIFNLPNGLQAYYLADAGGRRLDVAPTDIVSNPAASDPKVRNGLSCIGCHTEGMKSFEDQVRDVVEKNPNPPFNKESALRLYVEQQVMEGLLSEDTDRYRSALEATGDIFGGIEPISRFHEVFQGPLDASHAAASVGLDTEVFLQKIRDNSGLQSLGLLVLENATLKRDTWTSNFSEIVRALERPSSTSTTVVTQTERIPGASVYIPDPNLQAAIAEALGKSAGATITAAEIATLDHIEGSDRGIQDLTGLEFAINATSLSLERNQISDLSPLAGLEKLNNLALSSNQISDLSPLSDLINLRHLSIYFNPEITDLSPLVDLKNLQYIALIGNTEISDISPLAGSVNLAHITAWGLPISDLSPLSGLTQLESLDICGADKPDLAPLAKLTGLKELYLVSNGISDVSPLAGLTNLTLLSLGDNNISDVSPLTGLTQLKWLGLHQNSISDFAPLAGLPETTIFSRAFNPGVPTGGPKIEGPWSWVTVPGERLDSDTDFLAAASGGRITEQRAATHGVIQGTSVGSNRWTPGKIAASGSEMNIADMLEEIGSEANTDNNTRIIYGSVILDSPREQEVNLFFGCGGRVKIWLNGELIYQSLVWRGRGQAYDYQDFLPVTLKQGSNALLVAIDDGNGWWTAFFGFEEGAAYTISPASAKTRVGYTFSESKIHINDTFTLDLSAEDVYDLAGWQFDITFDPKSLEAVSVTEGDFLKTDGGTTFFQKGRINNKTGKITGLSTARLSKEGVTGTGTLLSVTFTAKTPGQTRLKLENFQLAAITGEPIPIFAQLLETLITIEGELTTGDVNRDGQVSILDMVLVARHFGETVPVNSEVDLNGDGVVSILDLILVSQHMGESTAAAPSVAAMNSGDLDAAMVQAWIAQAALEDDGSVVFQEGLAKLQALLSSLLPKETALLANYPNPFNPETWIPYHLSESAEVTLRIYATNGEIVRTLALGHKFAGLYVSRSRAAYWDGRNGVGESVASGIYFYTLTAGDFTATRKLLIRK